MWGSTTNSPSKTTKIQSWNNRLPLSQHPLTRNWHRQRTNSLSKTTPKLSAIVGVLFVLFENSIYLRIESCKSFNWTFFWTVISPMAWKQDPTKILVQKCRIWGNNYPQPNLSNQPNPQRIKNRKKIQRSRKETSPFSGGKKTITSLLVMWLGQHFLTNIKHLTLAGTPAFVSATFLSRGKGRHGRKGFERQGGEFCC